MLKECLENVRKNCPLVHNITNYVTVNDCANVLIACGASPIMSDDKNEVEDITSICSGLNINIGTLNESTIKSMFLAGKRANELNHPVLLDPVGAGASQLRTTTALDLINEIKFSVIRGNISEIKTLALGNGNTMGVDASDLDKVNEDNLDSSISFIKEFAKKTGSIIIVTGKIDIVTDGNISYAIRNGNSMMSSITGSGCQLSAILTAYISANRDNMLNACVSALCLMGYAGERAKERLKEREGNGSFRTYLTDEIYNITGEELERGAKYEVR